MTRKIFIIPTIFIIFVTVAVAQTNDDGGEAYNRGTQAAQAGNFRLAKMYYETALDAVKREKFGAPTVDEAKIRYNLGVCAFRVNNSAEAVKHLQQAIDLSGKKYQKAFYALGMAETALENWKAAREAFRSAINLKNDDGEAWFDLALVFVREKNYEDAAEAFRAAIKHGASNIAASHNNLGVISAFGGDPNQAEREFQIAVSESEGKFAIASRNLQILRAFLKNRQPELLAKLEINQSENKSGEVKNNER
ncbi:MAG: tetratricopeptide repeat protein [Pyrinomonadaceae bacterium]|nr:tetratricopeptide repeat protein [Pyrinomonadaceae bacterium]